MNEVTTTTTSFQDVVDGLDFSVITDNALYVIGAAAGVVIGVLALKKGWAFLKSQIRGA